MSSHTKALTIFSSTFEVPGLLSPKLEAGG